MGTQPIIEFFYSTQKFTKYQGECIHLVQYSQLFSE